ncbi:hypothetical protein GYA93_17845 [Gordonia desulfuricans]|uniref:Uncharacterized protein n=1 Tax=Gordonia desulfuricans TaxID=89051 RepID=A0A7K3LTJ8_9ACTN|nr:hypothetical protein [Gordonia desulfuricans]NDK91426.1 hypothetical protein [Gordonia desulfuricans]
MTSPDHRPAAAADDTGNDLNDLLVDGDTNKLLVVVLATAAEMALAQVARLEVELRETEADRERLRDRERATARRYETLEADHSSLRAEIDRLTRELDSVLYRTEAAAQAWRNGIGAELGVQPGGADLTLGEAEHRIRRIKWGKEELAVELAQVTQQRNEAWLELEQLRARADAVFGACGYPEPDTGIPCQHPRGHGGDRHRAQDRINRAIIEWGV